LGFGHESRADDASLDSGAPGDGALPLRAAYIKASNTETYDLFGWAIALSGDGNTLAVGAPQEDGGVGGINVNEADNTASAAGAVYVFVRSGATWIQQAYVKASNAGAAQLFGNAVALSADGNTLVVGAYLEQSSTTGVNSTPDTAAIDAGAAYVFTRNGSAWAQQAYLKASNTNASDHFGASVAISGSGDLVAVGAEWESSNATGVDGDGTNNLAASSGAVYLFSRSGTVWSQQAYIKASNTDADDNFGQAVALSADGTTLAVGASAEDSGAPGIDGNQADNSTGSSGAAYVFAKSTSWTQQAYVKASLPVSGDYFARRLVLSATGDVLLVSSPGEDSIVANSGAAYVFTRSGTAWSQAQELKASNPDDNDQYGSDVALSGTGGIALVSAVWEDSCALNLDGDQLDNSCNDSGAAYAYGRSGSSWSQAAYAKPTAATTGEQFGFAAAMSGDGTTTACSMPYDTSGATGIDGNPLDGSAQNSGAVVITYY
jgi:hypothetical protein